MTASELKKSILQMAVEGKLTEQSEKDEPVEKLLKRIKEEREKLIKEGKIKKEKTISEIYKKDGSYYEKVSDSKNILKDTCIDEELPFEIPDTWTWVKINSISKSITAGGDKPNNYSELKTEKFTIPILSNGKENDGLFGYTDIPKIIEPSITISGRGTIGFSCVRRYPYFPIVRLISIIPFNIINLDFIKIVFDVLIEKGVGTSVKQLTVPMLIDKLIPLPPIEEQKRIVEKINLLMPLINEYDELEKSITKLNKEFSDNIKKSILQYAIEGKLTEQSEKDEPVEELLKRIKEEREKLIKEGKIKKDKTTSEIYKKDGSYYERVFEGDNIVKDVCIDDELPFEIPDSWVWVRFNNIVSYSMGKTPPRKENEYWDNAIFPWVSIADLIPDSFLYETKEKVNEYSAEKIFKNRISTAGTLLMSFKLTVGKVSILGIDAFHNEAIISIYPFIDTDKIVTNYLFLIMPLISQSGDTKTAIKGNTLNTDSLNALYIPLPPIEEQKRIVDKINRVNEVINTIKV
ncbi:restriction endonuclease subunit S [Brachyspira pulli]|uniref:restriction endonuclease subunit S n=1 Tax=Brachyspira pulli TaxID=310721 RepID=UPI0030075DA1